MIKKLSSLLLLTFASSLLMISTASAAVSNCGIFKDVTSTNPNCEAIKYAYDRGIFEGYNLTKYTDGSGDFKPDQPIIRAEVIKVALAAFSTQKIAADTAAKGNDFTFTDLKGWGNQWWFAYLKEALKRQMIEGYQDGSFKPLNNITRAEFLKVFLSASPKIAEVKAVKIHNYDNLWADTAPTAWYAKYIFYANQKGLFADFGFCEHGSICPDKTISRAEVAQMMFNYHHYLNLDIGYPAR